MVRLLVPRVIQSIYVESVELLTWLPAKVMWCSKLITLGKEVSSLQINYGIAHLSLKYF